jgi:hypothetical protein
VLNRLFKGDEMKKLLILLSFTLLSCRPAVNQSDVTIDVNVPRDIINEPEVISMFANIQDAAARGQGAFTVIELFSLVKLTKKEMDLIQRKRPNPIKLVCNKDKKCRGTNSGEAFGFRASKVKMPPFGTPSFNIGKNLYVELKLLSDTSAVICKITGMKVKKGFFSLSIDGAIFSIDGQQVNINVDAGFGGSFPNNECSY